MNIYYEMGDETNELCIMGNQGLASSIRLVKSHARYFVVCSYRIVYLTKI